MRDPFDGWCGFYELTLEAAVRMCQQCKEIWGPETLVAISPQGKPAEPYWKLALTCAPEVA